MRLPSIVALFVVTASLALGGCAADAESASKTEENVTHSDALEANNGFAEPSARGKFSVESPALVDESERARAIEAPAFGVDETQIANAPFRMSPKEMAAVVDKHTSGTTKP
jgi:hypothetical protein